MARSSMNLQTEAVCQQVAVLLRVYFYSCWCISQKLSLVRITPSLSMARSSINLQREVVCHQVLLLVKRRISSSTSGTIMSIMFTRLRLTWSARPPASVGSDEPTDSTSCAWTTRRTSASLTAVHQLRLSDRCRSAAQPVAGSTATVRHRCANQSLPLPAQILVFVVALKTDTARTLAQCDNSRQQQCAALLYEHATPEWLPHGVGHCGEPAIGCRERRSDDVLADCRRSST